VSVYKTKNGRLLNKIKIKPSWLQRWFYFFVFKPQPYSERVMSSRLFSFDDTRAFEVSPDGTTLYVIHLELKIKQL
jgi:hypothetical protein